MSGAAWLTSRGRCGKTDLPVKFGGEGGIRTPETLASLAVFKTAAFNHSATSPFTTFKSFAWTTRFAARIIHDIQGNVKTVTYHGKRADKVEPIARMLAATASSFKTRTALKTSLGASWYCRRRSALPGAIPDGSLDRSRPPAWPKPLRRGGAKTPASSPPFTLGP